MDSLKIVSANSDKEIQDISNLASIIWNEHFISILIQEQIDYMVDKFQSYLAIKEQITDGYEYFQLIMASTLIGYIAVSQKETSLFLSKLYIKRDYRGQGVSSFAFDFLKSICKERSLSRIWLTCNKYNNHTLDVYKHWGFISIDEVETDIGNGFIMDDYIMEWKYRE